MKVRYIILFTYCIPFMLGAIAFFLCLHIELVTTTNIVLFYQEKMRGSLFAGFLTLGSFLLSLKTGIVIKIKENVYDNPSYHAEIDLAKDEGVKTTVYAPLKRLSTLLSAAVFSAILASALQLTLGLLSEWWAVAICLAVAAIAIGFLFEAFALIQINLRMWFDHLDNKAEKDSSDRKAIRESEKTGSSNDTP